MKVCPIYVTTYFLTHEISYSPPTTTFTNWHNATSGITATVLKLVLKRAYIPLASSPYCHLVSRPCPPQSMLHLDSDPQLLRFARGKDRLLGC
jgi:hypothetical protein